jgi:hypothetical protein
VIPRQRFEEFEKFYTMEVLRNPWYRYGQAFMNYFPDIEMSFNNYNMSYSSHELWEEPNASKARAMCLEWIDDTIDPR